MPILLAKIVIKSRLNVFGVHSLYEPVYLGHIDWNSRLLMLAKLHLVLSLLLLVILVMFREWTPMNWDVKNSKKKKITKMPILLAKIVIKSR